MADTILSLLEPGEYVLNRNAVDKLGKKALDKINYKEAPRFPNRYQVGGDVNYNESILGDYFSQQQVPDFWSGMYGSLSRGKPDKKSKKALGSPSRPSIPVPMDEEGMLGDVALDNLEFDDIEQFETPKTFEDILWEGGDEEFAGALGVEGYQDGGSVSYGGYESENPSLTSLYEMFGVKPNEKNLKRFQEYDPSREGVHYEDYQTALDKSRTTGTRGMEQLYGETAGVGGFAGSGAAEKARGRGRKSLMEDYLSGQKSAYSSLFKGVRSERETWLKEMGSQLSALEESGGTDEYKKPGAVYDGPPLGDEDTGPWNPPENPSTGDSYMATNGQEYMWHFRDGWIAAEDFRSNYDFGPQREGAGGP
jgi:hypothetical protein